MLNSLSAQDYRKLLIEVCDQYLEQQSQAQYILQESLAKKGFYLTKETPEAVLEVLEKMSDMLEYNDYAEAPLSTKLYLQAERLKKKNTQLYRLLLEYIKRQAVREIKTPLVTNYRYENKNLEANIALARCEQQLNTAKTIEILEKNYQSFGERFLKILSVISILVGIGIFTTAALMIQRLIKTKGHSANFFKTLPQPNPFLNKAQAILKNRPSLFDLVPSEVLTNHIFNNLNKQELAVATRVNKGFQKAIANQPTLFQNAPYALLDYQNKTGEKTYTLTWPDKDEPLPEWPGRLELMAFIVLENGRIVTGHRNGVLRILDTHTGEHLRVSPYQSEPKNAPESEYRRIASFTALPDGKQFISFSADDFWRTWDSETGKCLQQITTDKPFTFAYGAKQAVLPNGNLVVLSDRGCLQILDKQSGKCLHELSKDLGAHFGGFHDSLLTVLSDSRVVTCRGFNMFEVWNSENGQCLHSQQLTDNPVALGVLTGDRIVGIFPTTVRIWDSNSWKCEDVFISAIYQADVASGYVLSDGQHMVLCYNDGTFQIFNTKTKIKHRIENLALPINSIKRWNALPDGRIITTENIYKTDDESEGSRRIGIKIHVHHFAWRKPIAKKEKSPEHSQETSVRYRR